MRVNPGGLSGSGPILVLLIYQVNHNELDRYSKYVRFSFKPFVKNGDFSLYCQIYEPRLKSSEQSDASRQ